MWVYIGRKLRKLTPDIFSFLSERLNWTEEVGSKSTDKSGTSGGAGGRYQKQVVSILEFGEGS